MTRFEKIIDSQGFRDRMKIVLLVLWSGVIFFFSSLPGQGTIADMLTGVARKSAHFGEYAILMFLVYKALRLWLHESFSKALFAGILLAGLYAASDEFHQWFVPGRTATVRDVIIDLSGILIMACLIYLEREHQLEFPHKRHIVKM